MCSALVTHSSFRGENVLCTPLLQVKTIILQTLEIANPSANFQVNQIDVVSVNLIDIVLVNLMEIVSVNLIDVVSVNLTNIVSVHLTDAMSVNLIDIVSVNLVDIFLGQSNRYRFYEIDLQVLSATSI